MVGLLTIGIMWSCTAIISSFWTIGFSGGHVLDNLDAHKRYLNNQKVVAEQNKMRRDFNRQIQETPPNLRVMETIPGWIQELREWAINELSHLSEEDFHIVKGAASVVHAGRIPGVTMRLKSGKAYDYDHWQALCAFVFSTEARKAVVEQKRSRPVEVDPFDEPRRD